MDISTSNFDPEFGQRQLALHGIALDRVDRLSRRDVQHRLVESKQHLGLEVAPRGAIPEVVQFERIPLEVEQLAVCSSDLNKSWWFLALLQNLS